MDWVRWEWSNPTDDWYIPWSNLEVESLAKGAGPILDAEGTVEQVVAVEVGLKGLDDKYINQVDCQDDQDDRQDQEKFVSMAL